MILQELLQARMAQTTLAPVLQVNIAAPTAELTRIVLTSVLWKGCTSADQQTSLLDTCKFVCILVPAWSFECTGISPQQVAVSQPMHHTSEKCFSSQERASLSAQKLDGVQNLPARLADWS